MLPYQNTDPLHNRNLNPWLFLLGLLFVLSVFNLKAQEVVYDQVFQPDYRLSGQAANWPGPRVELPKTNLGIGSPLPNPFTIKSKIPTDRIISMADVNLLPDQSFSVELWMINHVNQPIGAAVALRNGNSLLDPNWLLGYYGNEMIFGLKSDQSFETKWGSAKVDRGWNKYWLHVVATFNGEEAKLYFNGVLKHTFPFESRAPFGKGDKLEVMAFTANEPYMTIPNIVKRIRVYDGALSKTQIFQRLKENKDLVRAGIFYPDLFHFSAGPYLHMVTPNSINLTWETSNEPKKVVLRYGEELPFAQKKEIEIAYEPTDENNAYIQTYTLDGLKPATPYFYQLDITDHEGKEINSGVLTFATAPNGIEPFTFGVIGDTEARPHVNFQVAQLLWDERPNFVINLGDLTDGGKKNHKFEWTHEYFAGITPLASRIPIFPVAGNGESDLYWYNRYHKLPAPEAFYTFTFGDAQFFMLNSNDKAAFAPGGEQYTWLEDQLKQSTATWKFVCHHHAPYSSDENDYGDSWKEKSSLGDLKVRAIVPLYEKYGVDIVFFGHLHTYQRTLPIFENHIDEKNGVVYLQGGGAGGNLEDFAPNRSWFSGKTYRGHHYFTISVLNQTLQMKMYDSDGNMKDFMTIEK